MKVCLGVDVGSVSVNMALLDESGALLTKRYLPTSGRPLDVLRSGLHDLIDEFGKKPPAIAGVGVTGSGRELAGVFLSADLARSEITAHGRAASLVNPEVRTVIEIGGQDSKVIILQDGMVVDFAMNNVCAAGTGAFIESQCRRLGISLEEFSSSALRAGSPVSIAGRCTVFAESDMIYKQQQGFPLSNILNGLCESLARNYINSVARNRELREPLFFQGGVAANEAIHRAFERLLERQITVPEHFECMGAIGAAHFARESAGRKRRPLSPRGFAFLEHDFFTDTFMCDDCENHCEIVRYRSGGRVVAHGHHLCGKWA